MSTATLRSPTRRPLPATIKATSYRSRRGDHPRPRRGVRRQPSVFRSPGERRAPTHGHHSTTPRRLRPPPWRYRLLQLHHGVAIGYAAGRLSLRIRKLRLELPDDGHQNRRRAPVGLLSDAPDLERVGAPAFIAAGKPPISVLRMGGTGRATR